MKNEQTTKISKFLSLILRHNPEKINLKLDKNGWANVEELITKSSDNGVEFTVEQLEEVVYTNDKKRFSFDESNKRIRANQGHSLQNIDLELTEQEPPLFLYHGTVSKFMPAIKTEGLKKMNRQHVHLSKDLETANKVGSRRGVPIILSVRSGEMHKNGYKFYLSDNKVWLTDNVPPEYINFKS